MFIIWSIFGLVERIMKKTTSLGSESIPNVKNRNFALESFFLMISCKILKRLKNLDLVPNSLSHVVSQNSSNMTASESTDDDSEFNQIRVRQIVKKIIYGVKFIWISIGNLDPTIIFVILEWLLLVYWSRSISLVFLRGSPLDRRNSYRH